MKKLYFIGVLLGTFFWYGCSKEVSLNSTDSNAPAPAQISDIQTISTPGGAILTYKIPSDPNLLYVKAVYEIQPGVFSETKSSIYSDTLKLMGFGDTLSHTVKVYSVGKNEKVSEPVLMTVNPKTPPIQTVFGNVILTTTFGGVNVAFKNPDNANISIVVMVDSTGKNTWAPVTTFYTAAIGGNFSARGLKSVEQKFGVFIRDRWNNKSDTLIKMLTPLFETVITKNTWSILVLPTDYTVIASGHGFNLLWDNNYTISGAYASTNASLLPQWFTIDIGKKVLLSRFKEHQASSSHLYTGGAVKTFELWGSNSPDTDGGWKNWTLLGTFHSFKPSGLPLGQTNADDLNYGSYLGEDFNFDTPPPAVRYLRWKSLEAYSSPGQVVIAEIDLFGQIAQ